MSVLVYPRVTGAEEMKKNQGTGWPTQLLANPASPQKLSLK